jgi:hypothetical protein
VFAELNTASGTMPQEEINCLRLVLERLAFFEGQGISVDLAVLSNKITWNMKNPDYPEFWNYELATPFDRKPFPIKPSGKRCIYGR